MYSVIALSFLQDNVVTEFIADLLGVEKDIASYILIGLVALLLLIIILIIVLACKKKSKKKAAQEEKQEVAQPAEKAEETKQEETKQEEVKEQPKQEEQQAEEGKEEVKEEPKEEKPEKVKQEKEKSEETQEKTARVVMGKYEVFPVNDVYIYRLKASNGEIIITSEIYTSAKGAENAIETVKKNVEVGELQISKDKHNLWQFRLFASNKRLLVASANYPSEASCQKASESFKRFAFISPIVNLDEDPEHLMEKITLDKKEKKQGGKLVLSAIEDVFEFNLKASNGAILCSSYEFKTRKSLENGIEVFKEAINNGKFFVVRDKKGLCQFKLYSASGRCVAFGEAYRSKQQAVSAANSVANFIDDAEVVDQTK